MRQPGGDGPLTDPASGAEAAGNTTKRYSDGTHRLTDPATTLARVMPLAAQMGVTRVAVLTGLDVIGIPVVAAYRPNSRSIAVHQGKGTTLAAAKASAVMEAVEIVPRRKHHPEPAPRLARRDGGAWVDDGAGSIAARRRCAADNGAAVVARGSRPGVRQPVLGAS